MISLMQYCNQIVSFLRMALLTVKKSFHAEHEEKKSKFLATLCPLNEFEETLALSRQTHPKASHHVTAFRNIAADNQIHESAKDDGEPAGTSGMPVLKTIAGANLIDCAVIVVRYFGGIKLGTGGLARAYSGAAKAVIHQATLFEWVRIKRYEIHCTFDKISNYERELSQARMKILNRNFDEKGVLITFEGDEQAIIKFLKTQKT